MSVRAKVDIGVGSEVCLIHKGKQNTQQHVWLTRDEAIELANALTDAVDQLDGRNA